MNAPSNAAKATRGELEAWLDGFIRDPAFLEAYPYYAAILAKMTPVADPSVARMAVSLYDGRFYLHVNVDSFIAEPQFLRGVLLHEVHHVVLGHLTHPKFAECEEPELMDLAIEMSANEYIEEELPPAVTWRAYSSVGIRAGQSTRERYEHPASGISRERARDRSRAPASLARGRSTIIATSREARARRAAWRRRRCSSVARSRRSAPSAPRSGRRRPSRRLAAEEAREEGARSAAGALGRVRRRRGRRPAERVSSLSHRGAHRGQPDRGALGDDRARPTR